MRYRQRRKQLGQNFIYNRKLLKRIVGLSSIGKNDLVLDIGAGKGLLTAELAKRAKHVIAIDIDYKLVLHLRKWFADTSNVTVVHADFLKYDLPKEPYHVFANPPYNIESKIARKILTAKNPPIECYLIIDKRFAQQFQFEGYTAKILYQLHRNDFIPYPKVNSVLVGIKKTAGFFNQ